MYIFRAMEKDRKRIREKENDWVRQRAKRKRRMNEW